MTFDDLNLAPAIVQAVREHGYETPTPIQAEAIPAVLAGRDLLGGAQTGTGKTAAFTLPLLQRLADGERAKNRFGGVAIRALVLFKFDYYDCHPVLISLLNAENVHGARYLRRSRNVTKLYMPLVETLSRILKSGAKKGVMRTGIDPVELYVSIAALSYFYFSNKATLSNAFGRAFDSAAARKARRTHVVEVILGYVRP